MERFGGSFGAYDDAEPEGYGFVDSAEDIAPEVPPSPVGQDERRMQVRAYNHWAALIGDAQFPHVDDLAPETLDDFGPFGVLLDFRGKKGIDDPRIAFLGDQLAEECGGAQYKRLSDVPGRSLLSRITDHYLQILANKAPIGFEAEFTNDRGASVLYRGILLPWSSNGEDIDYVFGVINWKEMADAATADALLSAIDAALDKPIPPYEGKDMDRMLDLSGYAENDSENEDQPVTLPIPAFGTAPLSGEAESDDDYRVSSPFDLVDEADEGDGEEYDEDTGEPTEWGKGFSGFGDEDTIYSVDYGDQGLEDGEEDEDYEGVVNPLGDNTASLGLSSLVSRSGRVKQSVSLPGMDGYTAPADADAAPTTNYAPSPATSVASAPRTTLEQRLRAVIPQGYGADEEPAPFERAPVFAPPAGHEPHSAGDEAFELEAAYEEQPEAVEARETVQSHVDEALEGSNSDDIFDLDVEMVEPEAGDAPEAVEAGYPAHAADFGDEEPEGLYDCLAAARELAQTARSNEDRGRKALYQAVGRAYDFSLEAAANPDDFVELLVENGLTVQDRAPMTPIVKLVFGVDYDKTRLTEYATVLGYAHRTGVARGTLDKVLAQAEGGLKGIVSAERQARKEEAGGKVETPQGVRNSLARKLRKIEAVALDDLSEDGPEFALVMVRRLPSGELVVLGEVPEDVPLVEKAARKLLG